MELRFREDIRFKKPDPITSDDASMDAKNRTRRACDSSF